MLSRVAEAFNEWAKLKPENKFESCCAVGHYYYDESFIEAPRPDEKVCAREKAWRNYVRLRDNNPSWPFLN